MSVATTASKRSFWPWSRRRPPFGYLYVAPVIIWFVGFNLFPIVVGLGLSLTDWNILDSPHLIGLANYAKLPSDPLFWTSMENTLYFAIVSVGLGTVIALALAVALNQKLRFLG